MRTVLLLLSLITSSFLLLSAKPSTVNSGLTGAEPINVTAPAVSHLVTQNKPNFIQRLLLKFALRNLKKTQDTAQADKLAKSSYTFGIVSVSLLLVGLLVPYFLLVSIPAAIVAIATGNAAIRGGTSEYAKAKKGKALGIASLISLAILVVLAAIVVAALLSSWH